MMFISWVFPRELRHRSGAGTAASRDRHRAGGTTGLGTAGELVGPGAAESWGATVLLCHGWEGCYDSCYGWDEGCYYGWMLSWLDAAMVGCHLGWCKLLPWRIRLDCKLRWWYFWRGMPDSVVVSSSGRRVGLVELTLYLQFDSEIVMKSTLWNWRGAQLTHRSWERWES